MTQSTEVRDIVFRTQLVPRQARSPCLFRSYGLSLGTCGLDISVFILPCKEHPGHQWLVDTMSFVGSQSQGLILTSEYFLTHTGQPVSGKEDSTGARQGYLDSISATATPWARTVAK